MNKLAHLYVKIRLLETASGNQTTRVDTLKTILRENHFSQDSLRAVLAYFKAYPQAWIPFYKKVETLSRPRPPKYKNKKNPAPK